MKAQTIQGVRNALKNSADQKTLETSQRFFKEGEKAYMHGVKAAEVRKIAKEFYRHIKDAPKADVFEMCEELWKSAYLEEAVIACVWSESQHKKYAPSDFNIFRHWVENYIDNWAACDTLCNHTIGTFIMMYPDYLQELKKWAKSPNRWVKRASAVSLIIPARKGMFLEDIFEIAEILLTDSDHMVQKGYGWMLKVASQAHQKEVFSYVISKKTVMPRTALRYAIEKMPGDLRAEAMRK
ncbi:MAG: DNA alkylation repair protein [Bacteroidales bacterium]|nr:DNA alkylation repair protein [Bacteroidales bacterium]MCF8346522.1 DNA alkylation repair protein [Bacteroidales bacterium]